MTASLLALAAGLGLLAFFEPCSVATHAVYAGSIHRQQSGPRNRSLLGLWLARTLLLSGLFALFARMPVAFLTPAMLGGGLFAMSLVYLVSRYAWLPIPHLELYRLLPAALAGRPALRLGLTIPACTLPLVIVLGVAVALAHSAWAPLLAAVLYSSLFVLPTAVSGIRGLGERGRALLTRATQVSPFVTAALLLGLAAFLVLGDAAANRQALMALVQTPGLAAVAVGFVAGFIFSFNPVSFAAIPVMLAYVTRSRRPREAVVLGAAFVAGLVATHVVLGIAAAAGGAWARELVGRGWGLVLGPVLMFLGLVWFGWVRLSIPWIGARGWRVAGIGGAFLLGVPFSVAICPFCTPALMVMLAASAAVGQPGFGLLLLLAFALGRSIPVVIGAVSIGWLESLRELSRYQRGFEVAGGVVLVLSGLYLLNEYFLWIVWGA